MNERGRGTSGSGRRHANERPTGAPCTRRRALHGATALLGALAGCSGSSSTSSRSAPPERAENVETDPEHYALRNPRNEPAVGIRSETEREDGSGADPDERSFRRAYGLIASREEADRLAFADVEGADGARTFVEATAFDRETLLVEFHGVGECYAIDLCYVTWSATEYHTYYARLYRDWDVPCSTDERDRVTVLVRVPDALDPEAVTGSGSGLASGGCYPWERRLERRHAAAGNATARDGAGSDAASGGQ